MAATIRLLPLHVADGPWNMAADEVMLEVAVGGRASLRVYHWDQLTLSLGYFQRAEERLQNPQIAMLPWVRRATGGGAIIHGRDLTYAIALPRSLQAGLAPAVWHEKVHHALTAILNGWGTPAQVLSGSRPRPDELGYLCFAVPQPGDVLLGAEKIIGGAQRLRAGALLQHGSIQFPLNREQSNELAVQLARRLDLELVPGAWDPAELARIEELAATRYRQPSWNAKR